MVHSAFLYKTVENGTHAQNAPYHLFGINHHRSTSHSRSIDLIWRVQFNEIAVHIKKMLLIFNEMSVSRAISLKCVFFCRMCFLLYRQVSRNYSLHCNLQRLIHLDAINLRSILKMMLHSIRMNFIIF